MFTPYPEENISRQAVVYALARIRQEWQEVGADSLVDTRASVGLLLADLTTALDLTPEEQNEALGEELYRELFMMLQYA